MAHVNQQVRDEVVTRLEALGSLQKVSSNRGAALLDEDMPAAIVQTPSDTIEDASKGWSGAEPLEKRTIRLVVVLVLNGDMEDIDDAVDAIRADVEAAVIADGTLGGIAKDVTHVSSDLDVGEDVEGEHWFVFLALDWEVEVWTHREDPETAV